MKHYQISKMSFALSFAEADSPDGLTSSMLFANCATLGFESSRLISSSSELDLIITPLLFVDEPAVFKGVTSMASDGEVPLNVGSFSRDTPGILVTFFSQA
jgi:hypothetical protein